MTEAVEMNWAEYADQLPDKSLVSQTGYTKLDCTMARLFLTDVFNEVNPSWLAQGLRRKRYIAQQWINRSTSAIAFLTYLAIMLRHIETATAPSDREKLLGKLKNLMGMKSTELKDGRLFNGHFTELMVMAQFAQAFGRIELEPATGDGFCDFALTHAGQTIYFEITRPFPEYASDAMRALLIVRKVVSGRITRKGLRARINLTLHFLPEPEDADAITEAIGSLIKRMEEQQSEVFEDVLLDSERRMAIRVQPISDVSEVQALLTTNIDLPGFQPLLGVEGLAVFEYSFEHEDVCALIDELLTERLERKVRRKRKKQLPKGRPSVVVIDLQDFRLSNLEPNLAYAKDLLGQLLASRFPDLSGVAFFIDGRRYTNPAGINRMEIVYNQSALEGCGLSEEFIRTIQPLRRG